MSDARFLQPGFEKQLAHLVEECGEVLAAAGKTQRWGLMSVNPLLPPAERETNRDWLARELVDLQGAIERLQKTMAADGALGRQEPDAGQALIPNPPSASQ